MTDATRANSESSDRSQDALGALREQLVEGARRSFRKPGFKSVSMDDLARQLGRSKKTLYQVVDSKTQLIDLVLDGDMRADDEALRQICETAQDAVDEMLQVVLYFTTMMREINPAGLYDLQKYYRPSWELLDCHRNDRMVEHVRANLRRGQGEGLYRSDMDRELVARLFVHAPHVMLDQEQFDMRERPWEDTLTQFMRYHLHGVCNAAGLAVLARYLNAPS